MKKKTNSSRNDSPLTFSKTFQKELLQMSKEHKTTPRKLVDTAIDYYIKNHKLGYLFEQSKPERKSKK